MQLRRYPGAAQQAGGATRVLRARRSWRGSRFEPEPDMNAHEPDMNALEEQTPMFTQNLEAGLEVPNQVPSSFPGDPLAAPGSYPAQQGASWVLIALACCDRLNVHLRLSEPF